MTHRLPGFSAEASLFRSGVSWRGPPAAPGVGAVRAALIARPPVTGCGCGLKECCCSVQIGRTIVYSCCPRDRSSPCYSGTLPALTSVLARA